MATTTKEPPRQLRSMAASPSRRASLPLSSRSRTSSTASSSTTTTITADSSKETPKTTRSSRRSAAARSISEEITYKPGSLIWVKWSDARPYGAVVIGFDELSQMYTVRFGYDGVEVKRKPEHILEMWNPADNMNDTFGKYYEQLFKRSDPKAIQKALIQAKRQYEQAYEKHLKEQAQKEEPKVLLQNVVTKLEKKATKKKSLSDLTLQLKTKAASQQEQQVDKEATSSSIGSSSNSSSVNVQVLEKRSRKAPPSRRASTTITPERRTRQSTPTPSQPPPTSVQGQTHQEPRMMPKSVKDSLMKKETPPSSSSSSSNTVKLSAFAHSPRKTPPMSPLLSNQAMSHHSSPNTIILSPRQTRPAFEIGDRVKILTAGNAATVEKILALKNRPYEYMIRVENGPRYKLPESELWLVFLNFLILFTTYN